MTTEITTELPWRKEKGRTNKTFPKHQLSNLDHGILIMVCIINSGDETFTFSVHFALCNLNVFFEMIESLVHAYVKTLTTEYVLAIGRVAKWDADKNHHAILSLLERLFKTVYNETAEC